MKKEVKAQLEKTKENLRKEIDVLKLDEIDRKILNLIQRGDLCTPRVSKIASIMGLPTTTVHSRLKNLEKKKAIIGYQGIIDSKKVGTKVTIFAVIKVRYEKVYYNRKVMEEFGKKLASIPEVQEVHACSGDWDYLIKLKVKSVEDYYRIASEKILPLGGIEKLMSYTAYNTMKETAEVRV